MEGLPSRSRSRPPSKGLWRGLIGLIGVIGVVAAVSCNLNPQPEPPGFEDGRKGPGGQGTPTGGGLFGSGSGADVGDFSDPSAGDGTSGGKPWPPGASPEAPSADAGIAPVDGLADGGIGPDAGAAPPGDAGDAATPDLVGDAAAAPPAAWPPAPGTLGISGDLLGDGGLGWPPQVPPRP